MLTVTYKHPRYDRIPFFISQRLSIVAGRPDPTIFGPASWGLAPDRFATSGHAFSFSHSLVNKLVGKLFELVFFEDEHSPVKQVVVDDNFITKPTATDGYTGEQRGFLTLR